MRGGVQGLLGEIVIYGPTKSLARISHSVLFRRRRDGAAGPLTVDPRRSNLYQSNLALIKSPNCCKQSHSAISLANSVKFDLNILYGGRCECEAGWREYLSLPTPTKSLEIILRRTRAWRAAHYIKTSNLLLQLQGRPDFIISVLNELYKTASLLQPTTAFVFNLYSQQKKRFGNVK